MYLRHHIDASAAKPVLYRFPEPVSRGRKRGEESKGYLVGDDAAAVHQLVRLRVDVEAQRGHDLGKDDPVKEAKDDDAGGHARGDP